LAARWRLNNADGAALLGVSESAWDRITRGMWCLAQTGSPEPTITGIA
jgi:hypothetical protein